MSTLKRGPVSTGEEHEQKKPRRSNRLSSQSQLAEASVAGSDDLATPEVHAVAGNAKGKNGSKQQTPLKENARAYPSPYTHGDSTTNEYRASTASPPEGRPSQINHRSPALASPLQAFSQAKAGRPGGLSSPPSDTQPFTQTQVSKKFITDKVVDEDAEGVWGYLVPLDSVFGETLVLRTRTACPAPMPNSDFGKGTGRRAKGQIGDKSYKEEEIAYEKEKRKLGFPSGGYLIGRHPECDRKLDLPTISNRHCIVFNENKNGQSVAVIEDLSSNGTFVNEAIIGRNKRHELNDSDEISVLDQARFMFFYPSNRHGSAFMKQYRLMQPLGKGHFATVYLCVEKATGVQYAVKKFERRKGKSANSQTDGLQQEIGVLKSVSHPNVLCLQDTFDEEDGVYIILELAPEGELFNHIIMKGRLSEEETRKVFVQLFQGIRYLHERNIVHRDIKPENILLSDRNLSVKIADFGLAKIIGEESFTTTLCGTPSYVAPEILESNERRKYTRAVDVWALGVVLYICLCGFPPFSDELYTEQRPYKMRDQILRGVFDYPSPYWDDVDDLALDLIDKMLTVDPDQRISIDDCLEHPWITQGTCQSQSTSSHEDKAAPQSSLQTSASSLAGALRTLDFSHRKPQRERTLLADMNEVKISNVVRLEADADAIANDPYHRTHNAGVNKPDQPPVKIFEKNPAGKIAHNPPPSQSTHTGVIPASQSVGTLMALDREDEVMRAPDQPQSQSQLTDSVPSSQPASDARVLAAANGTGAEETPFAHRRAEDFMELGGKGDVQLFAHDHGSRYEKDEVPE